MDRRRSSALRHLQHPPSWTAQICVRAKHIKEYLSLISADPASQQNLKGTHLVNSLLTQSISSFFCFFTGLVSFPFRVGISIHFHLRSPKLRISPCHRAPLGYLRSCLCQRRASHLRRVERERKE